MSYKTVWENKGVVVHFYGDFNIESLRVGLRSVFSDSRSDNIQYLICDHTEVVTLQITADELAIAAALDCSLSLSIPSIKLALISKGKEMEALSNRYVKFTKRMKPTWHSRIFEDITSARDWIDSEL